MVLALLSLAAVAPAASAQNAPQEIEQHATDAPGTVRLVFTPTGQVLGRSDYLPFGETLNQNGTLPRQRFTGQPPSSPQPAALPSRLRRARGTRPFGAAQGRPEHGRGATARRAWTTSTPATARRGRGG